MDYLYGVIPFVGMVERREAYRGQYRHVERESPNQTMLLPVCSTEEEERIAFDEALKHLVAKMRGFLWARTLQAKTEGKTHVFITKGLDVSFYPEKSREIVLRIQYAFGTEEDCRVDYHHRPGDERGAPIATGHDTKRYEQPE